jgi:uncharacterized membrane protein
MTDPLVLIIGLAGVVFIITGFIILKYPPRKINMIYGYRSGSSMKSQERWDYAQKFSSKEMMRTGILMLIISAGIYFLEIRINEIAALITSLAFIIATVSFMIIRTEKSIRKKFGKS